MERFQKSQMMLRWRAMAIRIDQVFIVYIISRGYKYRYIAPFTCNPSVISYIETIAMHTFYPK